MKKEKKKKKGIYLFTFRFLLLVLDVCVALAGFVVAASSNAFLRCRIPRRAHLLGGPQRSRVKGVRVCSQILLPTRCHHLTSTLITDVALRTTSAKPRRMHRAPETRSGCGEQRARLPVRRGIRARRRGGKGDTSAAAVVVRAAVLAPTSGDTAPRRRPLLHRTLKPRKGTRTLPVRRTPRRGQSRRQR